MKKFNDDVLKPADYKAMKNSKHKKGKKKRRKK